MELKGSKTEQNLMAAFAGESQARNKYTYYAQKAREEGMEQIAAIFEETARNEQEHAKLWFKLFRHGGFDILVTHAPAYQLNDGRDLPHQGFQVFKTLIEKYRPKFFLHGHVHMSYGRNHKRYDKYQDTHVINAFERCVFEFEDENPKEHIF